MANHRLSGKLRRKFEVALADLRDHGIVSKARITAGIDAAHLALILERYPDARAEWEDAKATANATLLQEAIRRGRDGVRKPVFWRGEEVATIQEYSDSLLSMLVKGRFPEFATERREVTGAGGGPIRSAGVQFQADLSKLDTTDLETLLKMAEKLAEPGSSAEEG